jgi:hypothetical protein
MPREPIAAYLEESDSSLDAVRLLWVLHGEWISLHEKQILCPMLGFTLFNEFFGNFYILFQLSINSVIRKCL